MQIKEMNLAPEDQTNLLEFRFKKKKAKQHLPQL